MRVRVPPLAPEEPINLRSSRSDQRSLTGTVREEEARTLKWGVRGSSPPPTGSAGWPKAIGRSPQPARVPPLALRRRPPEAGYGGPAEASAKAGLKTGRIVVKSVYVLRSAKRRRPHYVGITQDFERRLWEHNADHSPYTSGGAPWTTVVVIRFDEDEKAMRFEEYLKSGSGRAFAKRHFL